MYSTPDRRQATYGLAGAHDRQPTADRHTGSYRDFLRRHEAEAMQAACSSRRERQSFTTRLHERAADTRNIILAIEHCASRGQAAGPDGLRPRDLDRQACWRLADVLGPLIREVQYQPETPRTIRIEKGCGRGTRLIHIQDFADRVVERAVLQVIRALLQSRYLDLSFGFRTPGRTRESALITAERLASDQDRWLWIGQDFRDAFDMVPRGRLMQLLRRELDLRDSHPILRLIDRMTVTSSRRGIRQGGPLSPELLNLYLHCLLDTWWQQQFPDVPLLRWADDLLILPTAPEEADQLHTALEQRSREIGMPLKHSRLVAIRDLSAGAEMDWLGYGLSRGTSVLNVRITGKSWFRLEEHLQLAWEEPRCRGSSTPKQSPILCGAPSDGR
jgi:hypothetical protein